MSNPIWQHRQQLPDPENNDPWWSSRPVIIILLAVAAIIILTILWHSLLPSNDYDREEVPYITADQRPIKTRPENPGGYQPPHKDKMVYELISNDKKMGFKEKLQPKAEEPMAETKFHDPSDLSSSHNHEVVTLERAKDSATYNINSDTVNIYSDDDLVDNKPEAVKPHVHGDYHIQVASMDSQRDAEAQWHRLKKRYKNIISSLSADFVKATVKGKTYYRVYVGNFDHHQDAQDICTKLKKAGADCFVVKR